MKNTKIGNNLHRLKKLLNKKILISSSIIVVIAIFAVLILTHTICIKHDWQEATCSHPQECKYCHKTVGEPLEHTPSDWSKWDVDYDKAIKSREKTCTICGDKLDIETKEIKSFLENKQFKFHPNGFASRFDDSFDKIKGYKFDSIVKPDENKFFYDESNYLVYEIDDMDNNYRKVGVYAFTDKNGYTIPYSDEFTEGCSSGIVFSINKTTNVSPIVFAAVLAIDPNLSYDEATDLGQTIIDNVGKPKGVTKNSINYVLLKDNGYSNQHYLTITVVP